jgi:hypothetical protein
MCSSGKIVASPPFVIYIVHSALGVVFDKKHLCYQWQSASSSSIDDSIPALGKLVKRPLASLIAPRQGTS